MRTFRNEHNGDTHSTDDKAEIAWLEHCDNWHETDSAPTDTAYARLNVKQLKALCAERELEVAGDAKKPDLVAELEADDVKVDELKALCVERELDIPDGATSKVLVELLEAADAEQA